MNEIGFILARILPIVSMNGLLFAVFTNLINEISPIVIFGIIALTNLVCGIVFVIEKRNKIIIEEE